MTLKAKQLKEMGNDSLNEKLARLRGELAKERAAIASGTRAEKPATIGNLRRDIARILTVINQTKADKKR